MESQLRVGVDVGCHAHRVGIADPDGSILEKSDISRQLQTGSCRGSGSRLYFWCFEARSTRFAIRPFTGSGDAPHDSSRDQPEHSIGSSPLRSCWAQGQTLFCAAGCKGTDLDRETKV